MNQVEIYNVNDLILNFETGKQWAVYRFQGSSYLLCFQMVHYAPKTMLVSDGLNQYICGLIRFVNLEYLGKLKKLFSSISTKHHLSFPKQWLCLYEISSYIPKNGVRYKIQQLAYGDEVFLKINNKSYSTIVSNCFGLQKSFFYILEDIPLPEQQKQVRLILNAQQKLLGLCLNWCGELIGLPIHLIVANSCPKLRIKDQILPNLQKTVYLQYQGSHCTGTLISKKSILSVRHLFNVKSPQISTEVNLKLYPYNQTTKAKIVKIYSPQVDLVLFQIVQSSQALSLQSQQNSKSINYLIQTKPQKCWINFNSDVSIGEDVKAIGFGRFDYSFYKLPLIELILPTVTMGIVSKKMYSDSLPIIFKTDASLHHGFSGCGIWSKQMQKGVAVFIVKNTTNSNELTRHNFNYFTSYIYKKILKESSDNVQGNESQLQAIKNIGKFGVRSEMKIMPSL